MVVPAADGASRSKKRKPTPLSNQKKTPRGVLYIGHLPHGFYDRQLTDFFKQFGVITNCRMAKSKKVFCACVLVFTIVYAFLSLSMCGWRVVLGMESFDGLCVAGCILISLCVFGVVLGMEFVGGMLGCWYPDLAMLVSLRSYLSRHCRLAAPNFMHFWSLPTLRLPKLPRKPWTVTCYSTRYVCGCGDVYLGGFVYPV